MDTSGKIINWIKGKVRASGAKGVIIGLSGGVDSALVAVLTRKAVGRKKLLCLWLPCESPPTDFRDALLIARKFNLQYRTIDISPVYKCLRKILPPADRKTTGNLKARLRMLVIYYFANKLNYLVIGTGNRSELLTGYFTKYGDGAVDLLPLGNLLKREVRELAKAAGVPLRIINKCPTAGLWTGQSDETEMGISYNKLDDILFDLGRGRKPTASAQDIKKVKALIKSSEHKRQLAAMFKW